MGGNSHACRLRPTRPEDAELLLRWENDPALWEVSGTVRPFTHEEIEQFILRQQEGIHRCGQQRWMIENEKDEVVGTIDLFEFDPHRRKAGVGILVYDPAQRRRGYARQALEALEEYAQRELQLERLWCEIFSDNEASLALFRGAGYQKTGVRPRREDEQRSGRCTLRFEKKL